MAGGGYPYEGCIASSYDHIGDIAILYDQDMNLIGYFECKDTGGAWSIQNGTSIDVYRDNIDRAWDFIGQYSDHVYVQFIDCE